MTCGAIVHTCPQGPVGQRHAECSLPLCHIALLFSTFDLPLWGPELPLSSCALSLCRVLMPLSRSFLALCHVQLSCAFACQLCRLLCIPEAPQLPLQLCGLYCLKTV